METDKLTHILVECPELIASVRVGVLEPLRPLSEKKQSVVRFKRTIDVKKKDIIWCDVLVCVRGSETRTRQIVKTAKENGRYIIYFLDDDLLNIPEGISCTEYYQDELIQNNLKAILQMSDVLWVVNPKVGKKYSRYCKNWIQTRIPTVVESKEYETERDDLVRFLYAGSKDHERNVKKYLVPAIQRICKKYRKQIRFVFVGVDSGIKDLECVENYSYFDDYFQYREFIRQQKFAYGLAVIETNEFYQAKYYNKYIEYGSFGIVGLYTNAMPYTEIINNGYNGYLVGNDVQTWYHAIQYAIEHYEENHAVMQKNINQNLKEEFCYAAIEKDLRKYIEQLVTFKAPKIKYWEVKIDTFRYAMYVRKANALWKQYNLKALPMIYKKGKKKVEHKIHILFKRMNKSD